MIVKKELSALKFILQEREKVSWMYLWIIFRFGPTYLTD